MAESSHLLLAVATVLVFTLFGNVAHGQCITPPINVVVYEGTKNIVLSCGRGPSGERWTVRPTSKAATEPQITNFTNSVSPTLTGLYGINQSGLLIRNATINPPVSSISTAGVYYANFIDGSKTAVKVVVIRSGPTCSFTQSASRVVTITCTTIYADHPVAQMSATISCSADGRVYAGASTRTLVTPTLYLYSSTATIIVKNSSAATYDCSAAFTPPINELPFLAKNPPNFTANVTALEAPTTFTSTPKPTIKTQKPTTGQHSSGSLTRKPINTAAVDGSSNIMLECASIYGTDAIRWFFTPLGSLGNETISIANGDQLFTTYQQKYDLQATVDSSVLVVRQLSSSTEGTYRCYDGVESASALLLVIPFPISMEPLFGPVAGGTNITITGSATSDHSSSNIGSYTPDLKDAINVYIGHNLSATSVFKVNPSTTLELVAVTPATTETSIGQHLPIIIQFSSALYEKTPFNMTFNRTFTYLPNPEITGINPDSSIVDGGILIDVTGRGLSSVAKPIIELTVFIHGSTEGGSISNTAPTSTSRVCTIPPGSDSVMQCPMPPLSLPDDVIAILNSWYNTSRARSKRSIMPNDINRALAVPGPNGMDRADVYLGFNLDGYRKYENINNALPNTKIVFYSAPEINSSKELIEFNPSVDELIYVKGRYMMRGCYIRDYLVQIGNQTCTNSDLQENQLRCRPPKVQPSSTVNDRSLCDQHLSVTITVGYKQYRYACLTYTEKVPIGASKGNSGENKVPLIVGLTVGLVGFALLLIVIIVCVVRYRRQKVSQDTDDLQNSGEQEPGHSNYAAYSLHRPSVLFWRKKGVEGVDDDVNSQSHEDYYPRRRQEDDDNMSVSEDHNPRFRQESSRNISANEEPVNPNDTVYSLYRPRSLFFRRKGVVNAENDVFEQSHEEYYPRRRQDDDGEIIADEEYLNNFHDFVRSS